MIRIERLKQSIVFVVNILSPSINQVNIGNITNPVLEPINLADQTDPVASDTIRHAYQKAMLVGTPITIAVVSGLSFHHSEYFCRFNWYQPKIWPMVNIVIPNHNFINVPSS